MEHADRYDGADGARAPRWAQRVLVAAGLYNVLWGSVVVLFPGLAFDLLGMEPARYPSIWQCVGMIVGVYGVGYLVASRDPWRHWPIVLVGFLGKVLGPVGFLLAASRGELPWSLGWTILTNDLIWWVPFAMILWGAMSDAQRRLSPSTDERVLSVGDALARTTVDAGFGAGRTLLELSRESRLLVLFLRHSGCTFCREALADLRDRRAEIERAGARIVLVHLASDTNARPFFARYTLADVSRVSDPGRTLYRAFALGRGTFAQLFGARAIAGGVRAMLRGHGVGRPDGDGFQMPGAFLVSDGRIVAGRPHETAAERPDYVGMACSIS